MPAMLVVLAAALLLSAASTMAATDRPVADLDVCILKDTEQFDHDLCRRLAGEAYPALPRQHGLWPVLYRSFEDYQRNETLVAVSDGLIVGRAILEARYHPYCELVNLCVRPDHRNRGVATAIVREAISRARSMGFKVMTVQEYLQDAQAHVIYLQAGFLPATRGDMQRLIKLLDVPVVSNFLTSHPEAQFISEAAPDRGPRWWRLTWQDGGSHATLYLHGGSCQGDSDGFQPVLQGGELVDGAVSMSANVEVSEKEVARGGALDLTMTVQNHGQEPFKGVVRAVLLPNTQVATDQPPLPVDLAPDEEKAFSLPVHIGEDFDMGTQGFLSYRSAPLTLELCWEDGSLLLSAAVKIS